MQSLQKLIPSASDELRGEFKVGPFGETKSLGSLALLILGGDVLNICLLWKKNSFQQKRLVETSQTLTLLSRIKNMAFQKKMRSRKSNIPTL